jgi:hypothetical protein
MRVVLSIFLWLAIAFQGFGVAHAFQNPCPMGQDMVVLGMGQSASAGDCCNDADTTSKTGKLCKTGQVCSPSGAFMLTAFQAVAFAPSAFPLALANMFFMPSPERSSIWRPPTRS